MRCVSFYFERSCPEQRPRAAVKPQEPHSSGPWTPGALASRGVVGSWPWSRGSSDTGGKGLAPTFGTSIDVGVGAREIGALSASGTARRKLREELALPEQPAEALIVAPEEANAAATDGTTALHRAARGGHVAAIWSG
jgi:hypothetical protein